MAEITYFIRIIVIGATGLYLLHTVSSTMRANPHDSTSKTLIWTFGLLLALSMLFLPIFSF